jgi:hypothetical protein
MLLDAIRFGGGTVVQHFQAKFICLLMGCQCLSVFKYENEDEDEDEGKWTHIESHST